MRHFFIPILMKTIYITLLAIFILTPCVISCTGGDTLDIDEEKPSLELNYKDGFPQSCSHLLKGETYNFRVRATDNIALAAYSLDIHHNFDHHTHDNQGVACELYPVRDPENPFIYIENFSIENRPTEYEIVIPVTIPLDVDTGDYHCQFSVTDVTGWQTRTSVDIKIRE